MAAPSGKSAADLTGRWVLNKALSDDAGPLLQLQGLSWVARKAIGLAAVTVHLTSSSESGAPPSLTLTNTATNLGVQGTTEARRLDWQWADMRDYVWGAFRDRSRALAPDDLRRCLAAVAEAAQQQQQQQRDTERGRGPAAHGGGEEADGGGGRAQELWGFAHVGGARRLVREMEVRGRVGKGKADRSAVGVMVYDYAGE